MRKIIALLLVISTLLINAQQKVNEALKKDLDEIMNMDQGYRMLFDNGITPEKKEQLLKDLNIDREEFKKKSWQLVVEQDSLNMMKVEKIISQYGYPGKTLVGEPTNKSAWYVIQHSTKIGKYLPMIKDAGKKKEIPFTWVAMMEDRYLMQTGLEQIYGTQGSGKFWEENGKSYETQFIWPIKDPVNVNKRRKEAGFPNTMEEYAKSLYGETFIYRIYTLDDVKEERIEAKEIQH